MGPRPILKTYHDPSHDYFPSPLSALPFRHALHSPHVHFPPTPTLTSTRITHSPSTYDRAPIDVAPNTCELPGRGERVYAAPPLTPWGPGSTRTQRTISPPSDRQPKGSYFHPRAFEAYERERERDASLERRRHHHYHRQHTPTPPPLDIFLLPPPLLLHDSSSPSSSSSSSGPETDTDSDSGYIEVGQPAPRPPITCNLPGTARYIRYGRTTAASSRDDDAHDIPLGMGKPTPRRKKKVRVMDRTMLGTEHDHGDVVEGNMDISLDGCLGGF